MVQIGFKCDKGIMRQNNEDACFVVPGRNVYVVADGVGGNNSGEVASRTAVSEIARMVNEAAMDQYRSPEEIFRFFADIIEDVNEQIYQMGLQSQQNRGMATTIVTAYIRMNSAYIANIGDSRAYLFRSGKLGQITRDHTYVNELIDKGVITEDEAEHHEQKTLSPRHLERNTGRIRIFTRWIWYNNDILLLSFRWTLRRSVGRKNSTDPENGSEYERYVYKVWCRKHGPGGRDNITVICSKI